jgi:hypothetical protein
MFAYIYRQELGISSCMYNFTFACVCMQVDRLCLYSLMPVVSTFLSAPHVISAAQSHDINSCRITWQIDTHDKLLCSPCIMFCFGLFTCIASPPAQPNTPPSYTMTFSLLPAVTSLNVCERSAAGRQSCLLLSHVCVSNEAPHYSSNLAHCRDTPSKFLMWHVYLYKHAVDVRFRSSHLKTLHGRQPLLQKLVRVDRYSC